MPIVTGLTLGGFAQAVLGGILGAIVVRQVAGAPGGSARTPPGTGLPVLPGTPGLPGLPGSPGLPSGTVKGVDCAECGGDGCAACLVGVDDLDGLDEVGADEVGRYYPAWATSRILRAAYLRDRRARGILGVEDSAGFMAPHAQPHPERRDREGHLYGHESAAPGVGAASRERQWDAWTYFALPPGGGGVVLRPEVQDRDTDRVDAEVIREVDASASPGTGIFRRRFDGTPADVTVTIRPSSASVGYADQADGVNGWGIPYHLSASRLAIPVRIVNEAIIPASFTFSPWSLPARVVTEGGIPVRDAHAGASLPYAAAAPAAPMTPPPSSSIPAAAPLPARPPPAKTSGWEASLAGA